MLTHDKTHHGRARATRRERSMKVLGGDIGDHYRV